MKHINSNVSINLSKKENKLCNLLVEFANYFNKSSPKEKKEDMVLRISGGWVRDKLLGLNTNDIDIVVNNMTGETLTEHLSEYLKKTDNTSIIGTVSKIKKNPLKSKHLETCTTRLFGFEVDFVNLRSETYEKESRIPKINFGTVYEDASRRDSTINALFYNLMENKVEDFTKKGLTDLKNRTIQTPLEPKKTFLDDPLRVLRLIRFAAKLNFKIERHVLEAMLNREVIDHLRNKVSKERIGIEIKKMIDSENTFYGLRLISHVKLCEPIFFFFDPDKMFLVSEDGRPLKNFSNLSDNIECEFRKTINFFYLFDFYLNHYYKDTIICESFNKIFSNPDSKFLFINSVILLPYNSVYVKTHDSKSNIHFPEFATRDSLRYSKNIGVSVSSTLKKIFCEQEKINFFLNNKSLVKKSDLGLYFKNHCFLIDNILLTSCFFDSLKKTNFLFTNESNFSDPNYKFDISSVHGDLSHLNLIIDDYEALYVLINESNTRKVDSMKLLIDGNTLSKELGLKPGHWLKSTFEKMFIWQLDNSEKSKECCLNYLKGI